MWHPRVAGAPCIGDVPGHRCRQGCTRFVEVVHKAVSLDRVLN